jgi:hypothetical protein
MKTTTKFLAFVLVIPVIMCGCNGIGKLSHASVVTIQHTKSPLIVTTSTMTFALNSKETKVDPTIESTVFIPSITPVAPPELPITTTKQNCISVESNQGLSIKKSGVIYFANYSDYMFVGDMMLYDTNREAFVSGLMAPKYVEGGQISTDMERIAYHSTESSNSADELIILDNQGKVINSILWGSQWYKIAHWLGNNQVLITNTTDGISVVTTVNAITGIRRDIKPKFLKLFDDQEKDKLGYWKVAYNPAMSQVAYLSGILDYTQGPSLILWDITSEKMLWQMDTFRTFEIQPEWSFDGSKLAVVNLNQSDGSINRLLLNIVDNYGNSKKWIDVPEVYSMDNSLQMSWSPNGNYLVFVAVNGPVLILDLKKRELLNYCIAGNFHSGNIAWSPDSSQVLIPEDGTPSILLSLVNRSASYFGEDPKIQPVAWLTK